MASDPDVMPCGCRWVQTSEYGEVLLPCDAHKSGAKRAGSDRMTDDEFTEFCNGLSALGHVVVLNVPKG